MPDRGGSGVVFIGVTDDGKPAGLTIDDRLLTGLAHLRDQAKILPPPIMSVRKLDAVHGSVAVIEVEPSPVHRSDSTARSGSG